MVDAPGDGSAADRGGLIFSDNSADLGRFPIIVGRDDRAGLIVQPEQRVGQVSGYSKVAQGRSNRAEHDLLGAGPTDDKANGSCPD